MKKQTIKRKIIIIGLLLIAILVMHSFSYAENEVEENQSNTENVTETNTSNNTNTSSETTTDSQEQNQTSTQTQNSSNVRATAQETKSSNANLSNLGIRPNDFSGFKPGTTKYQVTVPEEVEEVEVYATTQDSQASVTGTGTKTLEKGINTLQVVVTAEDGTQKTYTIEVTREGENTENVQSQYSGDGLASLKIGDLTLTPEFDTNVYEYTVKYIGEGTELEVEATGTDPYYTIEVTGNKELVEGENIITILVSDPDGNNVAIYQVTVNKSLIDEEAIAREQEEARKKEEQTKMLIIGGVVAILVIGIIVFIIVRRRKNRAWAEEYTVPFNSLNDEDEDFYEDSSYEDEDEFEEQENDQWSKEDARESFLKNYHRDYENFGEEEIEENSRKRKHKGKRFK